MPFQKVYVIDPPKQTATPKAKAAKAGRRGAAPRAPQNEGSNRTKGGSWLLALRAYALGPLNLVLWPTGEGRLGWAIAGAGSLVTTALLSLWWRGALDAFARFESGPVIWALSVTVVVLSTATSWARAVAASPTATRWPRALRRAAAVCGLGLVLPGLGLLATGRRWAAAFAVWCAGIFVAGLLIGRHWRWIVASGGGADGQSVNGGIEAVLAAAAGCVAFGLLSWVALALDAIRTVSPAPRSSGAADGLALALLLALVVFAATFRPVPVAHDLGSVAAGLRDEGLRRIPLALYEAASKLDPATPAYLAEAATLCEDLGTEERAKAKRDLLEARAAQFAGAIGAELVPVDPFGMIERSAVGTPDLIDALPPRELLWIDHPEPRQLPLTSSSNTASH